MEASQNAYDVTTPLLRQIPQTALDAVFGAAALVSADTKLTVVGRTWDEFMARTGRSDLTRNAFLGSSILLFFRNEDQRRVFESLLQSMRSDELGVHTQVVDLGSKDKPFYAQLHVQGLWHEGVFVGYFVHCLDITREHANRLTLIDRDRDFQTQRDSIEKANTSLLELQEKLRTSAEEVAQREAQLRKVTEKSLRLEKSTKESLERAEKAVEKSSRLQHELDRLKKQQTDNTQAVQESERMQSEIARLSDERQASQSTIEDLEVQLDAARSEAARVSQEYQNATTRYSVLEQQLSEAQKELGRLKPEYQAASAKCASVEQRLTDAQNEVEKVTMDCQSAQAKSNALEQELATLKALHGGQAAETNAAVQEIARLSAIVREMSDAKNSSQSDLSSVEDELQTAKQEVEQLKAVLAEERKAPPQVVKEKVLDETTVDFLKQLTQAACYLDTSGRILSATGAFWEQLGAIPEHATGQPFAKWLGDDGSVEFVKWISSAKEACCIVTTANGLAWNVCAEIGADGKWKAITVEAKPQAAPTMFAFETPAPAQSHLRALSRELADEFSNLLTGVLGHASLAAAELDGPASRDIQAIERTAREAAQLVRKLSALNGGGRHTQENDLAPLLSQFVKKLGPGYFGERPQIVLCDDACRVHGDTNGLKIVLEAITHHARENLATQGQVCYTVSHADAHACLSLSYDGLAGFPSGWAEGMPPAVGQPGWDLVFAREVLRGMNGELELTEDGARSMLLITLPQVVQTAGA